MVFEWKTSCNPSRALPPLNAGSSSPRGMEDSDVIFQNFLQQATSSQLGTLMGLNSSHSVEDSVIIPCEFCGVQLEEEVLFHHQVGVPGAENKSLASKSHSILIRNPHMDGWPFSVRDHLKAQRCHRSSEFSASGDGSC